MLFQFVLRNLKKRAFLNFIKILGLALGLSGILFISLFLKNELSYDAYHKTADRIYRFTITDPSFLGNNHFARIYNSEQIPDLAAYFPEIENYVRLAPVRGGVMMYNEKYYSINEAFECDSTFFDLFDATLLTGNKKTVLNAPGAMVISASFAQKVFGATNPVGETLSLPAGQYNAVKTDFTIKGVMKDFPPNSHFHPDLITTPAQGKIGWWAWTYLLLKDHTDPDHIISGYADFLAENADQPADKNETQAHLQKLTDIHLHSNKLREIEPNGNMTNIYVLAIAAFILLLISMSNYASLNLGMAGFNSRFITINQILGATKRMSLTYSLAESLIIIAISIIITLLIVIPANLFVGSRLDLNLFRYNGILILLIILTFSLLGVLSGLQPVLKQRIDRLNSGTKLNRLNAKSIVVSKPIIVSQYALAIVLIAGVLVISRQTNFVLNNSMGQQEDNIICFESVHANIQQKFEVFKSELLKYNTIESVSAMLEPPGGEVNDMFQFEMDGYRQPEGQQKNMIGVFPCDYSFADLFHLKFLSGKNFSKKSMDNDGSGEYIINETALHDLNFTKPEDAIGKDFRLISPTPGIGIPRGKIIGVLKDFHLSSMKKKINPLVLFKRDRLWLLNFVVSYKPGRRDAALTDIHRVWQEMFSTYPFDYEHVGSMYRKVYKTELLQSKLLAVFTIISVFICSMGLLGLSLLVAQQRVKEIGIRKVNGAKVSEVMAMLNKNFVKWVVVAFVIATPVAYYAMNKWLENFAYKTSLSWWIFALAGLLALGIALLTVSFQSWKAATRNPVEALRYE